MAKNELTERIGLIGGAFNPIHIGHLLLAQKALETYELSRIIFIPCAKPPHKDDSSLAAAEHRLAMVEAAIADDIRFEVSDIEIRRGGISYTIDTVRELKRLNETAKYFFIIGEDSLGELHTWKDIATLLELCEFVVFARPSYHASPPQPSYELGALQRLYANIKHGRLVEVSSSEIRYRIAEGMSIRYLVPRLVEMYIYEHNLYRVKHPKR